MIALSEMFRTCGLPSLEGIKGWVLYLLPTPSPSKEGKFGPCNSLSDYKIIPASTNSTNRKDLHERFPLLGGNRRFNDTNRKLNKFH